MNEDKPLSLDEQADELKRRISEALDAYAEKTVGQLKTGVDRISSLKKDLLKKYNLK